MKAVKFPRRSRLSFYRKRVLTVFGILLIIAATIGCGYFYLNSKYTVKTVYVEGNTHYTSQEIQQMVMTGRFGDNSLYLSRKYKNKSINNIPFVETMDVSVIAPDTIKISVYEKALAGYIEYLGRYVYFDKDGVVVEVSNLKTAGIPEVIGVDFDYAVIYEKLPVDDPNLFNSVLRITQLMTKYGVKAEKMYFKSNGETVLYHDDITVKLGTEDNLDLKIMNLPSILSRLEGMSGTLRMEKYNESTKKVSFVPSRDEKDEESVETIDQE